MVQYGCGGRRSRLADVVGGDDRLTGEPRIYTSMLSGEKE